MGILHEEDAVPDRGLLQDRNKECTAREHAGDFCSVEGCDKLAQKYGLCTAHGGQKKKPCYTEGCCNLAYKGASAGRTRWGASHLPCGGVWQVACVWEGWDVQAALQGGPGRSEQELSRAIVVEQGGISGQ